MPRKRPHHVGKKVLGFGSTGSETAMKTNRPVDLSQASQEDLLSFGLIPEFIGRLPIIAALQPLDRQQLMHILTEPKNAMLKQYRKLLAMDGVELHVTQDGLEAMADDAFKRGTGARALRSIFEKLMLEVMFEAPSRNDLMGITVDRDVVMGHSAPILMRREDAA